MLFFVLVTSRGRIRGRILNHLVELVKINQRRVENLGFLGFLLIFGWIDTFSLLSNVFLYFLFFSQRNHAFPSIRFSSLFLFFFGSRGRVFCGEGVFDVAYSTVIQMSHSIIGFKLMVRRDCRGSIMNASDSIRGPDLTIKNNSETFAFIHSPSDESHLIQSSIQYILVTLLH